MPWRTPLITAFAAIALTAPLDRGQATETDPLLLEDYFVGEISARGSFSSRLAGVKRNFDVKATGYREGDILVLVEDFVFEDGETDRKTWRFRKIAPGRYAGTREDVVGDAEIVEQGGKIYMRYLIDIASEGGTQRLRFSDVLYRGEGNTVINKARVSKFGIPVAKVEVIFDK